MLNSKPGELAINLWLKNAVMSKKLDSTLGVMHGISLAEYMVLKQLGEAPDNALRRIDIAESMFRSASAITKMLAPMEKIGLVKKQSNARDARVSLVKLTEAGVTMYKDATATLDEKSEVIFRNLGQTEKEKMVEMLQTI